VAWAASPQLVLRDAPASSTGRPGSTKQRPRHKAIFRQHGGRQQKATKAEQIRSPPKGLLPKECLTDILIAPSGVRRVIHSCCRIRESLRLAAILIAGLAAKPANQFAGASFAPRISLIQVTRWLAAILIAGLAAKPANQFAGASLAPRISVIRVTRRLAAILIAGLAAKPANQFAGASFAPRISVIRVTRRLAAILIAGLAAKPANQFAGASLAPRISLIRESRWLAAT